MRMISRDPNLLQKASQPELQVLMRGIQSFAQMELAGVMLNVTTGGAGRYWSWLVCIPSGG